MDTSKWRQLDEAPMKGAFGTVGITRLYRDHTLDEELPFVVTWQLNGSEENVQARFKNKEPAQELVERIAHTMRADRSKT
jgi:hypothetical protein